jgi:hypothetical protein
MQGRGTFLTQCCGKSVAEASAWRPASENRRRRLNYYCRRCGGKLDNPRRKFHPGCLDADKRERTAAQRQRERSRAEAFHRRQPCPCCGKRIGAHPVRQQAPAPAVNLV